MPIFDADATSGTVHLNTCKCVCVCGGGADTNKILQTSSLHDLKTLRAPFLP